MASERVPSPAEVEAMAWQIHREHGHPERYASPSSTRPRSMRTATRTPLPDDLQDAAHGLLEAGLLPEFEPPDEGQEWTPGEGEHVKVWIKIQRVLWLLSELDSVEEQLATVSATCRAAERRLAELERNEHGHCVLCSRMLDTPYLERCHDTLPCVGKGKTA